MTIDRRWETLARSAPQAADLLRAIPDAQRERGYYHTLREIGQQPDTWRTLASDVERHREAVAALVERAAPRDHGLIVLTGSGSSSYVGECLGFDLQALLGVMVRAIPSGTLLTNLDGCVPAGRPCLMVSFARSGDSPESVAALELLLDERPDTRHLVITSNLEGGLARRARAERGAHAMLLDERTCDRSLVMTSGFTNLLLAGLVLAFLDRLAVYQRMLPDLAAAGDDLLARHLGALADVGRSGFGSAVFLGSGSLHGAALESALKMREMTAGRIPVLAETFLGLRHGPMSAVHDDTLVVGFLSPDPVTAAYERDLLAEMSDKDLGAAKVLVGTRPGGVPIRSGDTVVPLPDLDLYPAAAVAVLHLLVGQLLAFFRCLDLGLRPDAPSEAGVITRVVRGFEIHRRP